MQESSGVICMPNVRMRRVRETLVSGLKYRHRAAYAPQDMHVPLSEERAHLFLSKIAFWGFLERRSTVPSNQVVLLTVSSNTHICTTGAVILNTESSCFPSPGSKGGSMRPVSSSPRVVRQLRPARPAPGAGVCHFEFGYDRQCKFDLPNKHKRSLARS